VCCITLQHIATHCNTLQHIATHCNTLQHIANKGSILLHHITLCCNTLQHVATRCNTLQHAATRCEQGLKCHQQEIVVVCQDNVSSFYQYARKIVSSFYQYARKITVSRRRACRLMMRGGDEMRAVAFSPDGSRLARAEGCLVVVCAARTGFVESTLSGHSDE